MADSKISQLNFADKIYDRDLMVVVTGYGNEGSYPDNCKISLDRIRKDIIRLDEMIFFLSGFSGYYNTEENTFTITSHQFAGNLIDLIYDSARPNIQIIATTGLNTRTENLIARDFENVWPYSGVIYSTGLNARIGNNIEIQFSSGTPASDFYGGTEGKYKSGIISTTGLNASTENLIVRDFESSWPYSGIIYTTGLNAVIGNNMEIQFSSGTPASNIYGNTEGKYRSGIISTTGLNTVTENLIVRDFQNTWPYSGIIYNTGLNAVIGNNMEIQFSAGTPASNIYGKTEGKYKSGIISTTGLNARSENLIVRDFESSWPYSGVIYNTGLNAIIGNNMEIQFATGTPASNIYGRTGGKYISGIVSTTGLNSRTENLIVRDFEEAWPYSGIIYNTGLNAVIGNNMEIQFSAGTPASNIYGKTEGKYKSGIISTTGLNARTENLIVRDFESSWPYSGIIYNTGLNAVVGNNMEIQFATGTPASNKYGGTGGKYISGIISVTGLNARTENLIVRTFENLWPYSGIIYSTGLNARAGNNIEIDFSTSRHSNMGAPYHSGTISTTGLNMVPGTGITVDISPNWPYTYTIATLDRSVYSDATMTIDDTKTYYDPYINPNVPTKSSKYPSLPNNLRRGFLIEYCILSMDIINTTLSTVNTSGRPTEFDGNTIAWNSCYVTHLSPAALNLQVWNDEDPFGFYWISTPDQTEKSIETEFAFDLPTQGLPYYSYPPNSLYNINLKLWINISPWPDSYYDLYPGLSLSLIPAYSFVRSTYRWTCNGTYTYMIGGSPALGNTVWNSPTYSSDMTLRINNRYMKLNYATKEQYALPY